MAIRVAVNGAQGKMGQEVIKAINATEDLVLVAEADKQDDLSQLIANSAAQVVVDFTTASAAYINARTIIAANAHPVIGTSGLVMEQVEELALLCHEKKLGGIIAPNFALGAVLMMQYAQNCARYFPDVEIIEMHHANKADAPSGTAIRTAEMLAEVQAGPSVNPSAQEKFAGVRGGRYLNIPIHSIRLPGLVAHQTIMFGGLGQSLTIRHDTYNREAFMPGVCLACRKVIELETLVFGLEHIL